MSKVLVANEAAEQILQLPKRHRDKVAKAIDKLEHDPISSSLFLQDTEHGTDLRAIMVGAHGVIFSVGEDGDAVVVLNIFGGEKAQDG